jgi:hypothetical protein
MTWDLQPGPVDEVRDQPGARPAAALTEIALQAGYAIRNGCTVRVECDRDGGDRIDTLATFVARIEEEITIDDGVETSRLFRISGKLQDGSRLRDALVPASEFEGLSWVLRNWGLRALMFSGGGRRDHLRTAIQLMSANAASRTVYTHTGWRQEGDDWIYLHQGGAVGADSIEVRLDAPFERFTLPPHPESADEAIRLSLGLLHCGPLEVTVPLLASVYAAPVSFILNPDFALWVVGPTGSLKSELASLAQRHFGPFTRKTLPGSWCSTGNSLEALLSATKDMLAVIDDFAPQADAQAQREQTKRAEILLRNVGNHAARGRLKPDLTQRPIRPPRGLLVCTGEDHPPTPSIVARLVLVEVDRAQLNLPAISNLQANGERLPHAMRAYIEWLRPQIAALTQSLTRDLAELMTSRFASSNLGGHMRAPSGLATLFLGLRLFLDFALEYQIVTNEQAQQILMSGEAALVAIGKRQAQAGRGRTSGTKFVQAIAAMLAKGRVWLCPRDGAPGPTGSGPSTGFIGWRDHEALYLLPEAAHRAATTYLKESGEPFGISASRLPETLIKEGLAARPSNGRSLHQLRFPSARHRVIAVPSRLFAVEEESVPGKNLPALPPMSNPTPDQYALSGTVLG